MALFFTVVFNTFIGITLMLVIAAIMSYSTMPKHRRHEEQGFARYVKSQLKDRQVFKLVALVVGVSAVQAIGMIIHRLFE